MSCPSSRASFEDKPGPNFIWKEIAGNPNLFCWVPTAKKDIAPINWDLEDVNLQDIPPAIIPENYADIVATISDSIITQREKELLKKSQDGLDDYIVSVDDRKKYDIVKKFIQDKGLKVYGGIAINSYLPREEKIYNPKDVPDYDMYSPNPWQHAMELADIYHSQGYKYVEARAGIHKGTYKVFVNLWPVADITYMNRAEFDKMKSKVINGIRVVSPYKLLESMYKEFSEPYSNPARWPKVAEREKLLTKWTNPLGKRFACSKHLFLGGQVKINENLALLLESTYGYAKKNKLLFTGPLAYNTYMEVGGAPKRVVADHFRLLSENAEENLRELFGILLKVYKNLETTTIYYPAREFNPLVYSIMAIIDNTPMLVCEIIQLTNCTPYQLILNRYVVSIDYLYYDLYYTSVFGDSDTEIKDAKCKLRYLNQVQNTYYTKQGISEIDKSPFQRFITKCKGPFNNKLKVEILNRWLDREKRSKNIIKRHTKEYKIRMIPREKISHDCIGKGKDTCGYPCMWNKYANKCTDINSGIYRPSDVVSEQEYEK
jgi:hypothetical protein